jgi:large conductance mechanosensitive channel
MEGNLVQLAVAFIMGTAFTAVVTSIVGIVWDLIGKLFGHPDFSQATVAGINLGPFLTAFVAFLLIALILYFFVVTPYNRYRQRRGLDDAPTQEQLLTEIRDLLAERESR